jgi:chromosome segregation ATPase
MFQLGLTYATGQPPVQDRKRAREVFEELIALYPESELRPHAELILQLLAQLETLQDANRSAERQIQQLNEKLEQLKKIDMGPRPP